MDLNIKLQRERAGAVGWGENLQIKNKVVKTLFLDRLMKPHNVWMLQLPAGPGLSLKFLEVWKEMIVEVRGGSSLSGHPVGFRRNIVRGGGGGGGAVMAEETLR